MGVQYKTTKHSHYEELRCHPLGQHRQYTPRVKAAPAPAKTIAGLVVSDSRFSTLLAAVKAAGLVDTLSGAGPFTVFAPTNDAFAKVRERRVMYKTRPWSYNPSNIGQFEPNIDFPTAGTTGRSHCSIG